MCILCPGPFCQTGSLESKRAQWQEEMPVPGVFTENTLCRLNRLFSLFTGLLVSAVMDWESLVLGHSYKCIFVILSPHTHCTYKKVKQNAGEKKKSWSAQIYLSLHSVPFETLSSEELSNMRNWRCLKIMMLEGGGKVLSPVLGRRGVGMGTFHFPEQLERPFLQGQDGFLGH